MKKKIATNYIIISYLILSVLIELIGLIAIGSGFGINQPWMLMTLLAMGALIIYLFKNQKVRYYLAFIFLLIQGICNIFCIVLYEMTGTLFDFGMFSLRNDAMGILESIPLNFTFIFSFVFLMAVFAIFAKRFINKVEKPKKSKLTFIIPTLLLLVSICLNATVAYTLNNSDKEIDYTQKLYVDAQGKYKQLGMSSNFVNELYRGLFFNKVKLGDPEKLEEFIYKEVATPTDKFGVSSGNNLITILVESMEWFSFIQDSEKYPNGLSGLTKENIEYLFPNLTAFYDTSLVMDNFYAREKTDISENLSIIGSYPTNAYINYDFPTNTNPFTLPNILKESDDTILAKSYHNGFKNYYNRNQEHKSLGFESFTGAEDLYKMGMSNWASKGNRNLDTEMIMAAKDEMFPTDRRFYTYITSITMHGMYYERENLKKWYDKLDSINALPKTGDSDADNFRNYVAACMEFDAAVGLIIEDLTNKNLLDKTTIILFGDHNTYYQGLSNYVKDTYEYSDDDYNNLYRVAFMLKDSNLEPAIVHKFTTTTDIVPTVLDLFGINYYSNLYFGHSIFSDEESILYSRAYNIFLTDKVYFYNIDNILYKAKDVDKNYLEQVKLKAETLLKKLEAIDKIFYHDFFKDQTRYNNFISKMKAIN